MRKATTGSLRVSLGIGSLIGLGLSSCGGGGGSTIDPTESNVVVNVGNLPSRTTKLTVKATLADKPAMNSVDLTSQYMRFGFSLPYASSGRLVLDATSFDSDGCTQGAGQGQV